MRTIEQGDDLPRTPRVGDRIRLKEDRRAEYKRACDLAGYDCDLSAIREVIREDHFNPGGGHRLFVDGPPHCFASPDVELAWNSASERREALRAKGHQV